MDAIDRKILGLLVKNGRATHTEIGRLVGLSPHATADRIRRLLARGVITGFTASVDPGPIGQGLQALVDVRLLSSTAPEQFERVALGLPTVQSVAFVTGRFDYHVMVACDDAEALDRTVRSLRQQAGAAVTETRIVLRSRCTPQRIGGIS
jgi:Lrp/AsnC family leucine-responsive transcriptional regulator